MNHGFFTQKGRAPKGAPTHSLSDSLRRLGEMPLGMGEEVGETMTMAGKWMFIPRKSTIIGFDPPPYHVLLKKRRFSNGYGHQWSDKISLHTVN